MAEIPEMTVQQLSERLAEGAGATRFLDVRTAGEWETARIEGFTLLEPDLVEQLAAAPGRDTELVFLCHHGVRSEAAARHFQGLGFERVWSVTGGIDAWSREVDPTVPRY